MDIFEKRLFEDIKVIINDRIVETENKEQYWVHTLLTSNEADIIEFGVKENVIYWRKLLQKQKTILRDFNKLENKLNNSQQSTEI